MGSYDFELLEGRYQEGNFLARRAQLRLDGFEALVKRHGYPERGCALELGCGQGIRTRLLGNLFPDSQVMGLDRCPEFLDSARGSSGDCAGDGAPKNVTFRQGDLYRLPFEAKTFDFVYSRLVFQHLSRPLDALAEIRRVLRPGGRVLIEDADRACMFFEPAPEGFAEYWNQIQDGQRRLGGDPNIGRKLVPLLRESGFQDVIPEVETIIGGGEEMGFLFDTLLPSLNTYLLPEQRAAGATMLDQLQHLARDPRAVFYHFWFIAGARA